MSTCQILCRLFLMICAFAAASPLPGQSSHWLGFTGGPEGVGGPKAEPGGLRIRLRPESRFEGEGVLLREARSGTRTSRMFLFGSRRLTISRSALLPILAVSTESPILSLDLEGDAVLRSVSVARPEAETVAIRSGRYTLYQSVARGPLAEPWVRLRFREAKGADREFLLILERQPVQIAAFFRENRPASLEIRSGRTGRAFLAEISPGASLTALRRLTRITRAFPSALRETAEAREDALHIASTFGYDLLQDAWKTPPLYAAPFPPLASYAKRRGWAVRLPDKTEPLGLLTGSGPLYGLLNAREARYTIPMPPSAEPALAIRSPEGEEASRAMAPDRPRLIRVGLAAPWTEGSLMGLEGFLDACRRNGKAAFVRPEFPSGGDPAQRAEAWKRLAARLKSRGAELAGYDLGAWDGAAPELLAAVRASDANRDALIGPTFAADFDTLSPIPDSHLIYTFTLPESEEPESAILPVLRFRLRHHARVMLDASGAGPDEKARARLEAMADLCGKLGIGWIGGAAAGI